MKVRVTHRGIHDKDDKEIKVGTVITLPAKTADIPTSLVNKVEVIVEEPTEDKEPVVNPAQTAPAQTAPAQTAPAAKVEEKK